MSDDPLSPAGRPQDKPARSKREKARLVAAASVTALVALFAVLNLDEVKVNWIAGTARTPLIVVIAGSVLVGAALGFLLSRSRTGRSDQRKP